MSTSSSSSPWSRWSFENTGKYVPSHSGHDPLPKVGWEGGMYVRIDLSHPSVMKLVTGHIIGGWEPGRVCIRSAILHGSRKVNNVPPYTICGTAGTLRFGLQLTLPVGFKARVDAPLLARFSHLQMMIHRVNTSQVR